MFRKIGLLCIGIFYLMLVGCSKSSQNANDPRQVLTDYISKSFSTKKVENKEQLLAFMTGDVKARLAGWSNEQFQKFFIDSKREFVKLTFREVKEISPTESQITYELIYLDHGKDQSKDQKDPSAESKVTHRKLCQMLQVNGKWYIADVRNIKELIEFQNELSLP